MRKVKHLDRDTLVMIVRTVQELLYLDRDDDGQVVWNPDKTWNGADVCASIASLLRDAGVVPETQVPFTDD